MHTTDTLLRQMPPSIEELPRWFGSLSNGDFDRVCVSALTSIIAEEQIDGGFVSVSSIARGTTAIRDRYREFCNIEDKPKERKPYITTKPSKWQPLNELQVRVARRLSRKVSNKDLAVLFGVEISGLGRARRGATWTHIKQQQPPLQLSSTSHAA